MKKQLKITSTLEYFCVKKVVDHYQVLKTRISVLGYCLGDLDHDHGLISEIWRLFDSYVTAMTLRMCDDDEWLQWHIWENDCGNKGLLASVGRLKLHVNTTEDLVRIILAGKREKCK